MPPVSNIELEVKQGAAAASDIQQPFHVFSSDDVRAALPMSEAVKAMKNAYAGFSADDVDAPLRTHIQLNGDDADLLVMPSYCRQMDKAGVKAITLHPKNVEDGLPFAHATMMIIDARWGTPLALMDGAILTAIRTGAGAGAATDVLARPDASQVAIIGSGIQAASQLEAMCAVRPVRRAAVFDLDQARAVSFADRLSGRLNIEVEPALSSSAAIAGADIICTATSARTPVLDDADIEPGTHINAIGVYKTDEREIPGATVARARCVVEGIDIAWAEAGDLVLAREEGLIEESHIDTEVGEIIAEKKPGRHCEDDITLFKSVGIASQDLFAAHVVLARGTALGLGSIVAL